MSLNIRWSTEAEDAYENILIYLNDYWSAKEVEYFIDQTATFLKIIADQPYAFPSSARDEIRKAVIGRQNSLYYMIRNSEILLLTFWDNRMDPAKNPY